MGGGGCIGVGGRQHWRRARGRGGDPAAGNATCGSLVVLGALWQVWILGTGAPWACQATWAPSLVLCVFGVFAALWACFRCDP
jgi:hypothetical protein